MTIRPTRSPIVTGRKTWCEWGSPKTRGFMLESPKNVRNLNEIFITQTHVSDVVKEIN